MSRATCVRRAVPFALVALAAAPAALADEPPAAESAPETAPGAARADRVWDAMSGEIRAGWRFVRGEEDGRFAQDRTLEDGVRLFDATLRGEASSDDAALTSVEAEAHGVGDAEQSYGLRFGRAGLWSFDGTFDRDDLSYRATGDAWPYDTERQRAGARARWTPSRRVTVRLDWDRSLRRGDGVVGTRTTIVDASVASADWVREHRPLRQRSDRVTLGVDASFDGGFRASLAQTVRVPEIDDTRFYRVPDAALGGSRPVWQALRRELSGPAWTTVAKAGWRSPDGAWDVGAIASWTEQSLDARIAGSAQGFDNVYDSGGVAPKGNFDGTTSGGSETERSALDGRVEATWRPSADWDVTASVGEESVVDDASLRTSERRRYDRAGVPDSVTTKSLDARIVNRMCRASAEIAWQPSDAWRFRLGEEYLRENLRTPTDTRATVAGPTDFSSTSWRTTAGADWDASRDLDLSLLVRRGTNDDPHAATSAEVSDEASFRARWKPSDAWTVAATYRHKGYRQDTDLDSASRADSLTVAPVWTSGDLSVSPSLTCQWIETRTDTTYFALTGGSFQQIREQAAYRTRDVIGSLDVRWALSGSLRAFLTVTAIDSGRDYRARWDDAALGAEHDVRENLTVGAALRSWRLDEDDSHRDDYRVVGAEVWVTWRF